jgi:hypothetical protein
MIDLLKENDAPPAQFERLGLPEDGVKDGHLALKVGPEATESRIGKVEFAWSGKGRVMYESLLAYVRGPLKGQMAAGIEEKIKQQGLKEVDEEFILKALMEVSPAGFHGLFAWIGGIIKEKGKSI